MFLLQLVLGHAADTRAVEVGLFGLDAAETAELELEKLASSFDKIAKDATQLTFSYPCFFHFAIRLASAYPFFKSQSYSCFDIASFS
jgi:hypothetical protein